MTFPQTRTGECHGGPWDGEAYTAPGLAFQLDGITMPPNPLRSVVQDSAPPVAAATSRRTGWYRWHVLRLRWEWQGWEDA